MNLFEEFHTPKKRARNIERVYTEILNGVGPKKLLFLNEGFRP